MLINDLLQVNPGTFGGDSATHLFGFWSVSVLDPSTCIFHLFVYVLTLVEKGGLVPVRNGL
jgi:hypothetical protein